MIGTPLVVALVVALGLAGMLQGRRLLDLRWQPDRHTAAAIAAGLLPALLSALCLLLSRDSLAYRAVLFVGIFGLCGFAVPWTYVLFVEGHSPSALGVRRELWGRSLLISAVFAAGPVYGTLQATGLARHSLSHVLGAALQLNVGGLFETFLYCGFLHLRLRDAFGAIPAIVGSAGIYALWHIGTELPMHADPIGAAGMLFVIGLLCHALFATTYNVLAVWPLFFTAGVMYDFIVNLDLPEAVGASVAWSALGWALAVLVPAGLWHASRRRLARSLAGRTARIRRHSEPSS
jgi:CAAX protease family protein